MNEQLVVKNFGPIKDATVDFKRVTVFIGPTGGGKSTLAKLAAIFRDRKSFARVKGPDAFESKEVYSDMSLLSYFGIDSYIKYLSETTRIIYQKGTHDIRIKNGRLSRTQSSIEDLTKELESLKESDPDFYFNTSGKEVTNFLDSDHQYASRLKKLLELISESMSIDFAPIDGHYIPSERTFVSAIASSWAGLMRDDIGLPKALLNFANAFSQFRDDVHELDIPFLGVAYFRHDNKDFISFAAKESALQLHETASGIQSVTPLLVLLEHLSRNTEQAQSFIIEEPELNLYPTAQQGLLNWLVEKCTKGENDLTITTHSPYILSSCNLLLEAYKVAQQRPELADEIDKIVPRAYWLNPEEFAAYYVADGTVKPITDTRTHLIGSNELDAVSGDISDSFRQLLRLQKQKPASV